jgi:DNA replication protein DnaC/predicted ABC-type ATPase
MSTDLDVMLKRLHLANARRVWRELLQRAEKEEWTYDHLLQTLFAEEVAHRRGTRLHRAVRAAAFPFLRTVEEFDFTYQSTLRLTTIGSLLAPDFVTEGGSVILEGKPGRGKTHLAIAIAYRALQNGFDALFTTAAQLIDHLSTASRAGQMRDALSHYVRPHVLVVDEVGYLAYGDDAANVLYHVVNDRHIRRRAMIFTTNKSPRRWGEALHDDDLAEAIVDRILERGRLLRLDGPSVRTKHLPSDELAGDDHDDSNGSRVSGKTAAEFPEPTVFDHVRRRVSFAVETTLRTTAAIEQAELARKSGFATEMRFVATDSIAENIARVLQRAQAGGHGASEREIRAIHLASVANLPRAVTAFERVRVYDSTARWAPPRLVASARDGRIVREGSTPAWLSAALSEPRA